MIAVLVLAALGASLGIVVAVSAWTSPPVEPRARRDDRTVLAPRAVAAVGAAALGALATGWIVLAVVAAFGGWKLAASLQARSARPADVQERIEALAAWCEQLRDLLAANEGPLSTVQATVAICPVAIRPEVSRLARRLARRDPRVALDEFAAELADPSADLVASVLREAMSTSGRTAELLGELATTIRERATMRLRIEADRTGQRTEGRFVIGFAIAVMGAIVLFGRDTEFLRAYDDLAGQLALALVAAAFTVGVVWLNRLTRFDEPARFLAVGRRR